MRKTNNKAFTLVEVIVATSILMISVFGIYKLIGENIKLVNNNDNYVQLNSLFVPFSSCIDKIGFDQFTNKGLGDEYLFDFGGETMTGCTNLSSSGYILMDNREYYLKSIVTGSGSDYLELEMNIFSDGVGTQTGSHKLIK